MITLINPLPVFCLTLFKCYSNINLVTWITPPYVWNHHQSTVKTIGPLNFFFLIFSFSFYLIFFFALLLLLLGWNQIFTVSMSLHLYACLVIVFKSYKQGQIRYYICVHLDIIFVSTSGHFLCGVSFFFFLKRK